MYKSFILFAALIIATSCVPAKKYQELLAKSEQCDSELTSMKDKFLTYEAQNKELKAKVDLLERSISGLKSDTTDIGAKLRTIRAKYDKLVSLNEALETNYDKLRLSGAKETAVLSAELEAKQLELQQKEDELMRLEQTLIAREKKLEEQEKKLAELNEKLAAQEKATAALKERVSEALRAFENRGLTVEERNGKIYVSLEAKLLFKSGSTVVEAEGKNALIELAKVLESEKDLEIVVEGHTDTDPLKGSTHPTNNWELSVLRATSVIDILVANSQMDPSQLMAAGRSEYHPVDPNDKAKNRRIEIIISPDLDALFQLISE
ncbi:MAG: hypothetical protein EP333_08015 [Bacteroidetes bacterium]|nr:MAG: hypothetical protein EP333_08015 [Bacteroidota bacterium]